MKHEASAAKDHKVKLIRIFLQYLCFFIDTRSVDAKAVILSSVSDVFFCAELYS